MLETISFLPLLLLLVLGSKKTLFYQINTRVFIDVSLLLVCLELRPQIPTSCKNSMSNALISTNAEKTKKDEEKVFFDNFKSFFRSDKFCDQQNGGRSSIGRTEISNGDSRRRVSPASLGQFAVPSSLTEKTSFRLSIKTKLLFQVLRQNGKTRRKSNQGNSQRNPIFLSVSRSVRRVDAESLSRKRKKHFDRNFSDCSRSAKI